MCGLFGGHSSESSGIRPGDGYLRHPAFLARDAGDFASISFLSTTCKPYRVDFEGIRHEGPVLLSSRGRSSPKSFALADQLAMLTETIPALTSQMEKLRADQARLEGVVTQKKEIAKPAHEMDFPCPASPSPSDLLGFAKAIGLPLRTKTATPLRQMTRQVSPEDEPTVQPDQEGYQAAQHAPPGDLVGGGATQTGWIKLSLSCGGPFDEPREFCRSFFRKQLHVNDGDCKEREATRRSRKSLMELHATGGTSGFQKDETKGCDACHTSREDPFSPDISRSRVDTNPKEIWLRPAHPGGKCRC